jgi:prepilin-type N-terminal cleavage/methylation domain-containing protein
MKKFCQKNKNAKGFTIIETVVSIAIFAVISMTLFNLFNSVLRNIRSNKAILTANSIALEQLEIVRGMDFNNVKTDVGWVPAGPLASTKTLARGGIGFTIKTDIAWMDDSYDGCNDTCGSGGTSPCSANCTNPSNDTFPFDYKKVRIRVSWKNPIGGGNREIGMSTNIVPPGLEGLNPGKGGLYLTAFDSLGNALYNTDVTVSSASTGYNLTPATGGKTDLNGNIWIPDLNPAADYYIKVTKSGYSTAETYAVNNNSASPNYDPIPSPGYALVINQKITSLGFSIDTLGSMNIKTVHFSNPNNWQANAGNAGDQTETSEVLDASGNLFVAWADTRDGGIKHIYMQKLTYSAAGGNYIRSWGSDVRVVNQPNASNPGLKILPDGSLYLVWSDDRSGNGNIYLHKINTTNGSLIGSEYGVSHDSSGNIQRNPDLANDQDGNIYFAWEDNRSGNWDIYAQKFILSSGTFWGSDLKVNSFDSNDQVNAKIILDRDTDSGATNLNNFYVVWQSNHQGNFDIFLRKFNKDGAADASFSSEKQINSDGGSLDQYVPSMAFDGSNYLYIAWADDRNSQPDIYLQKIDKSGVDQFGTDIKINDDAFATARRLNPSIGYYSDGAIYVSWEDSRNGGTGYNIYASKINSTATRQWTYDFLLASTMTSNQANSSTLCDPSSGRAITVWQDNRSTTTYDIYGAVYSDMGNVTRANIPIKITGTKPKGKYISNPSPVQYTSIPKYSKTFTSDASGNITVDAAAGGLEWDSYSFSAGSPYSIISIDLPSPISILPSGSATVVINVGP